MSNKRQREKNRKKRIKSIRHFTRIVYEKRLGGLMSYLILDEAGIMANTKEKNIFSFPLLGGYGKH